MRMGKNNGKQGKIGKVCKRNRKGKNCGKLIRGRWKQLETAGESFVKAEMVAGYALVFVLVLAFSLWLELKATFMGAALVLCLVQTPSLYYHYKQSHYQRKRFLDINSYLSQMAQAFAGTGKILTALRDTKDTLPGGTLLELLGNAIRHIETACDVEQAQQEALDLIAETYPCQRVQTLHDFLLKAEIRGGNCNREFRLLEGIRQVWEQAAWKYRSGITMARNLVAFEYLILMAVCAFLLHQLPQELSILKFPLVQGANTGLIVCFVFIFGRMDRRLGKSMLEEQPQISQTAAGKLLSCVRNFSERKALLRQFPFAILALLPFVFLGIIRGNKGYFLLAIILFVLILTWKHMRYFYSMERLKREIKQVFPGWLFDLLLLLQQENVVVALARSLEHAPAVLRSELEVMKERLVEDPQDAQAFLEFLADFRLDQVTSTMRRLYALSTGQGAVQEVMELLIQTNMNMLAEQETHRLKLKGDLMSISYMLPTIPVMLCLVGYGIALMMVIMQRLMSVI